MAVQQRAGGHPMDAWVERLPVRQRERLRALHDSGTGVAARVHRARNGGFEVRLDDPAGLTAFLPARESGIPRPEADGAIGRRLRVLVIEPDPARGYPVVSRTRAVAVERDEALAALAPGERRSATVTTLKPYGAFVHLGDPLGDALVHVSEIAPGFVDDPAVHLSVGDRVEVVIVDVDLERGRISASIAQVRAAAWREVAAAYRTGARVQALVRERVGERARVELAPEVGCLVEGVPDGRARVWLDIDELDDQRLVLRARLAPPIGSGAPGLQPWPAVASMHSRWAQGGWDPWTAQWWDEHGFDDPVVARPWQAVLRDPSEARRWATARFEPEEIAEWRDHGFEPEDAGRWAPIVTSPEVAAAWIAHRFDPAGARSWGALEPAVASTWRAAGVLPGTALRLHDAGVTAEVWTAWKPVSTDVDAVIEWSAAGVPVEEAAVWMPSGIGPGDVDAWRRTGIAPSEVAAWVSEGLRADEAATWSAAGFDAAEASRWRRARVAPADARLWRASGIGPEGAGPWAQLGVGHEEAGRWVALDFDAAAAQRWRSAGFGEPALAAAWREHLPDPRVAATWRTEGWDDPADAAVWARRGWGPADAARARELGLEASAGAIPRRLAAPSPGCAAARTHGGRDLFGVPGADGALAEWVGRRDLPTRSELHARVGMPAAVLDLDGWSVPARWSPADVARLGPDLARRVGSRPWEAAALHRVATATPFLFRPQDAALFMEAEPIPDGIEVRLPFPSVVLVFGAGFRLEREHVAQLRRPGTSETFEPWLDCLHQRGGELLGVAVRAGGDLTLADDVVWLVVVGGTVVPVPGRLSKSHLATPVQNLLVGTTHPLRGGTPAPRRTPRKPKAGPAPRRASDVHVIDIRRLTQGSGSSTTTSSWRSRSSHVRRAHWHRYRVGPRHDWHYELRFILPTFVGGVPPGDTPKRVYRLPSLG